MFRIIGGYIVKKFKKIYSYVSALCKETGNKNSLEFIDLKERVQLAYPSKEVINKCIIAEKM